jgi:DNA-binding GntR family transcriptional regulator
MIGTATLIGMVDRLVIDRQLASQLRAMIESGAIGAREPLPSITYMVQETGLAVGTVRKAVSVLVEAGLAYTVPGRGTFVSPR